MSIQGDDGKELNAKVDIEDGRIILHSRGGAFGKPNLRNPDYREALVTIVSRLLASTLKPTRVLVDSRRAHELPEAARVVIKPSEFVGPVEELVTNIGRRVAAFGRKPGATGHGNQNKRILIEVPGAKVADILSVLSQTSLSPDTLPPMVYFNIGWMKDYAGPKDNDPTLGGHGWLVDHSHGHECFNFLPAENGEIQGYRPPGNSQKTNINQLGASSGEEAITGVLVVWLAREPGSGKTLVVGWYRDATVYREGKTGTHMIDGEAMEYTVTACPADAVLVPVGARSFEVKSSRTAPRGEGFGQKPTWYGSTKVNARVWNYVNSWGAAKAGSKSTKRKHPPKNLDPELRRKVEKAAVRHAWRYYEELYGDACDIQSVEPLGRGWDLEVRSGDEEWLVEVKGLMNSQLVCELTPNEYDKMLRPENREKYVVYIVNNALAEEPATPVPSIFTWRCDGKWKTDDGRELLFAEKTGAVLTCE